MKFCPRCKQNVKEADYRPSQYNKNGGWCRACCSEYENNNKDRKSIYNKEYGKNKKEQIKASRKLKKEQYNQTQKNRRALKKEIYNIRYLPTTLKYKKERRKTDPVFKLRETVSIIINRSLKKQNSTKNNNSIIQFLPYTIQELKDHLQSQFEPWMSWNNWGTYDSKMWDDHNTLTWFWNIDHIIPQSKLPYTSMEDDNFKKCWSLSNLRPYSAKQNIIDGNRRAA